MAAALTILFLLGATLGTALDGIHSHFGATAYTHPVFWKAAWWVPLLFGGAFTIGLIRPLLERLVSPRTSPASSVRRTPRPSWPSVLGPFAIFIAAYFVTVAPLAWPYVTGLVTLMFLVSWATFDRSPIQLAIALAAGFGGPAIESLLVSQGLFRHLQTLAFGVPGWLPALYLTASVALCRLALRLVDR